MGHLFLSYLPLSHLEKETSFELLEGLVSIQKLKSTFQRTAVFGAGAHLPLSLLGVRHINANTIWCFLEVLPSLEEIVSHYRK